MKKLLVENKLKEKTTIYNELLRLIERNIESAKSAMEAAIESKNNETKSSAGDKFETGRAMMQAEQDRFKLQWQKSIELKNRLRQIDLEKNHDRVEQGSLVHTNVGSYFISVGQGKIRVNNELYYAISLNSPMGKSLHGHQMNDKIIFQEREILIHTIY